MPVLPLVDLLILLGSGSLALGFVLKVVAMATIYRPTLLGFSSLDFVLIAGVCFGFSLVLVARTWLKLNEPGMLALQSRLRHEQASHRALEIEQAHTPPPASGGGGGVEPARVGAPAPVASVAGREVR